MEDGSIEIIEPFEEEEKPPTKLLEKKAVEAKAQSIKKNY